MFRPGTGRKLLHANQNVSTPTLSPDSEPSGAFCLQAAGNPSREFTINGSIKKKTFRSKMQPGGGRVAAWSPDVRPREGVPLPFRRICH